MKEKFGKGDPKQKGSVKEFKKKGSMELFTTVFVGSESSGTVCPAKGEEDDGMKKSNEKQEAVISD